MIIDPRVVMIVKNRFPFLQSRRDGSIIAIGMIENEPLRGESIVDSKGRHDCRKTDKPNVGAALGNKWWQPPFISQ